MAFTPGPWKAVILSWGWQIMPKRDTAQIRVIAAVGSGTSTTGNKNPKFEAEQEANANLIAAAPDLLEACKAAETELRQMFKIAAMYGTDAPFYPVLDQIRAAIAKAESTSKGR